MKKFSTLLIAILIAQLSFAQQNVFLKINHQLDGAAFGLNTTAATPDGSDFQYTRFEYYISEITLIHDGGIETAVPDTWLLINAQTDEVFDLGDFNIQNIEGISYYIGVDPDNNHLDPASFPATHPLAPQNPSMHWGWAAGYRFAAIEGVAGPSFGQVFEIHALGDQNYKKTTLNCGATSISNGLAIELNADYTQALKGIFVDAGLINHGFDGASITTLLNFRTDVFSPVVLGTSTKEVFESMAISIFPNPTNNGLSYLEIDNSDSAIDQIAIVDITGKVIQEFAIEGGIIKKEVQANIPGAYFVQFSKNGAILGAKKWLVR